MRVIKTIKFDLPIDGVKVKNVEELRDHFNTDILDLHKSGLLLKWLKSQRQFELLESVMSISLDLTDQERLNKLCLVFSIDLDEEIIEQLVKFRSNSAGIKIDPVQLEYSQFHEKYEVFMNSFKRYERFEQYCKNFNNSKTIGVGNAELIKMMHFIETGKIINIAFGVGKFGADSDYSKFGDDKLPYHKHVYKASSGCKKFFDTKYKDSALLKISDFYVDPEIDEYRTNVRQEFYVVVDENLQDYGMMLTNKK